MLRPQTLIFPLILIAAAASGADFSGDAALENTRKLVQLGPRWSGSPAHTKMQALILAALRKYKCEIVDDSFQAATPSGAVAMKNIIVRFPGKSGKAVAITGHYDTKRMPNFVGANDGGSSAGLLLEMARALNGAVRRDTVYLVFFDGEEAVVNWSDTDSIYGSRHLAEKWSHDGTLGKLKALINVDMTGDKDLNILREYRSNAEIRALIWKTANDRGYGRYFSGRELAVEDDHMPFLKLGVKAVDLIDFDYGDNMAYWHTPLDTMDKLSANSFQVVGNVLMEVVRRLEDKQ
jgi:glutaminyl-peptide cyclotransferase